MGAKIILVASKGALAYNRYMAKHNPKAALEIAIVSIGGVAEMARRLNVPKSTVSTWLHRYGKCGSTKAIAIEELTGVSRHSLRPDIFGGSA